MFVAAYAAGITKSEIIKYLLYLNKSNRSFSMKFNENSNLSGKMDNSHVSILIIDIIKKILTQQINIRKILKYYRYICNNDIQLIKKQQSQLLKKMIMK